MTGRTVEWYTTRPDDSLIGRQVVKHGGQLFKSGKKVGTIRGIVKHTISEHWAFTFEEDASMVEAFRCKLA